MRASTARPICLGPNVPTRGPRKHWNEAEKHVALEASLSASELEGGGEEGGARTRCWYTPAPTRHCESAGRTLQLKLPTKLAKPQILPEQESVRQVSRFSVVFRSVAIASWWDARVFSSFAHPPTSSGKVRPSTTVAHMTVDQRLRAL